MDPERIEKKKMEKGSSSSSRRAAYTKRRLGLFKKASELATLCDSEVAIILFSSDGEVHQQCSGDLVTFLRRLKECLNRKKTPAEEPKEQPNVQADVPGQEKQQDNLNKLKLVGKDLTGLDLQELHALEQKLNEGLLCLKERKEQILLEELVRCKTLEMQAAQEIENLSQQVEDFRSFFKGYPVPVSFSYPPRMTSNLEPAEKDTDTTLCLGLPCPKGQ